LGKEPKKSNAMQRNRSKARGTKEENTPKEPIEKVKREGAFWRKCSKNYIPPQRLTTKGPKEG